MAKQPTPGLTKTRLCPPLTGDQAASLYECFLRDTLEIMRKVAGVQRSIAFSPEHARPYFHELAPDMLLKLQRGASLGERLDHLISDSLSNGADGVVVIDSDSPSLPAVYVQNAFSSLENADVVLGPTRDGGYYLIGMKQPHPHLLRQVQMSTSQVLTDTLRLAENSGLKVCLLPEWYDVDTYDDLLQLHAEVSQYQDGVACWTRHWLADENLPELMI